MVPGNVARAANILLRYDAICHDLRVRPSSVLWDRLREAEHQLLTLTGADSVGQARDWITPAKPSSPAKPKKKPTKHYEGRPRVERALPPRITSVVSGGLPGTERRR